MNPIPNDAGWASFGPRFKTKIKGKVYDTSTSECLRNTVGPDGDDTELHQTERGEYFLKINKDAEIKLRPLTCREALRWCIATQIPKRLRGYLIENIGPVKIQPPARRHRAAKL